MTPISISSLNVAAKHMMKLSSGVPRNSKSFISYTSARKSYHESNYYSQHALHNEPIQTSVSNNAGGQVESSGKHFIKNCSTSNTTVSDVEDGQFVPSVSSDSNVSGNGHSKV